MPLGGSARKFPGISKFAADSTPELFLTHRSSSLLAFRHGLAVNETGKTMKKIAAAAVLCALLLTMTATTQAQSKHALGTIALSPDNSTLIAAGYNRVMYVCDPADLSVKQRIFLEIVPYDASFSSDGKSLVIVSCTSTIQPPGRRRPRS